MEMSSLPITALVSLVLGFVVLALAYTDVDEGEDHHPWKDYD